MAPPMGLIELMAISNAMLDESKLVPFTGSLLSTENKLGSGVTIHAECTLAANT